jgi:hypothetical protein
MFWAAFTSALPAYPQATQQNRAWLSRLPAAMCPHAEQRWQVCDAVEAGQIEVLADERSKFVKASLSRDHELIYPPVQEFWDGAVSGGPGSG